MAFDKYDVVVVGAGAAGLLAAGRAASLGAKVLLLEKMKQEGRKLMITGKGRCNISNDSSITEFIKHVHPNGKYLKPALSGFYTTDIVKILNDYGVETTVERGGRIFPNSNKALDVVHALVKWTNDQGVCIQCASTVKSIKQQNQKINGLSYFYKERMHEVSCQSVIVCSGGLSYPATGSTGDGHKIAKQLGHAMQNTRPALVPIALESEYLADLDGLNLRNVKAVVWSNNKKFSEAFGELSFMPWGLSGPIILTLSRGIVDEFDLNNALEIAIDLKPALDEQKLDARLVRDIDANGKMTLVQLFKQWVPMQLIKPLLAALGMDANTMGHQISGKDRRKIRILLKDFRFKVSGYRPFKEAIVTAGGIKTSEVSGKTMESKKVANLYFAGEILDVDADTGGYNLQIAFSTGWLAGSSAAKSVINCL